VSAGVSQVQEALLPRELIKRSRAHALRQWLRGKRAAVFRIEFGEEAHSGYDFMQ